MSRIEEQIVNAWGRQLVSRITNEVIADLKLSEAELSAGRGLANVWEEVCAQVQREESIYWSAYEATIEGLMEACLNSLEFEARLALWALTDDGWGYIYDHHADPDGAANVSVDHAAIIAMLMGNILPKAADYESPSLYRFLWNEDDPEYEEDDGEEIYVELDPVEKGVAGLGSLDAPVILGIHRSQLESLDVTDSLQFLQSLVPVNGAQYVWSHRGAVELMISGYDEDDCELFEIEEVRRYIQVLDQQWPFWFFFFTPTSIKLIGMCLSSAVSVSAGKAFIPPERLFAFMERGFAAVNHLFDHYCFPEFENKKLSEVVCRLFEE